MCAPRRPQNVKIPRLERDEERIFRPYDRNGQCRYNENLTIIIKVTEKGEKDGEFFPLSLIIARQDIAIGRSNIE